MSLKDPAILGIYSERSVERLGDSLRRVSVLERRPGNGGGGGGTLGGSILSGPVSAATSVTTGRPQWAGLGLGTASVSGVSLTISQPTMTDSVIVDTAGGGDWTSSPDGARYEIRHGSVGSRWTVSAPTMRIISYREQAMDISDHQDPNVYSTFLSMARGSPAHEVALQAGAFYTQNLSTVTPDYSTTNTDSQAVSGIGEIMTGGKGRAIGGFFYSWINYDADYTLAKGSGIEAVVENRAGSGPSPYDILNDHSVEISGTGAGSKSMCAFVVAKGPSRVATGIQLGADTTGSMQCGFYAPFRSSGTVIEEATFRDYGQAENSLDIGGVHTKAAIGIGPTSGGIVIGRGSKSAFASLDLGWDTDGVTPATTYAGGILFGNDTQLYRATTNTLRFDASGGGSARVGFGATNIPDTAAGDIPAVFIPPGRIDVSNTTSRVFRAFNSAGTTNEKPFFEIAVSGQTLFWGPGGTTAVDCSLGRYSGSAAGVGILRSTDTSLSVPNLTLSAPTGNLPQAHRFECRVGSQAVPSTSTTLRSGQVIQFFGDMAGTTWGQQSGWSNLWEWRNTTADHGDNMLGLRSTVYYGGSSSPVASRGTVHAISGEVVVTAAGLNTITGDPGEQAAYFGIVRDDTTGSAQSGRLWGMDLKMHGSRSSVANALFIGYTLFMNQYQSASPTMAPSNGLSITTSSPASVDSAIHSGTQTYPIDTGISVVGKSGSSDGTTTVTQGFKVGIDVGGTDTAWTSGGSRLGTGIAVAAYEDYGIRIWKRYAGSLGPSLSLSWTSASTASVVPEDGIDFGGDVNLYRIGASLLKTDDAFLINQSLIPGTANPGGTGMVLATSGTLDLVRNTTGTFLRIYGNSGDLVATPTLRGRVVTTTGAILEFSAPGGNSLDTTIARAAAGRLHVASELSAATGLLGGLAGTPSTGLDTNTGLATRRVDSAPANGANANYDTQGKSFLKLTGAATTAEINSLNGGVDGKHLTLYNTTAGPVTVRDESAALGTAANRIRTSTGGTRTIAVEGAMNLLYDTGTSFWNEVGGVGVT